MPPPSPPTNAGGVNRLGVVDAPNAREGGVAEALRAETETVHALAALNAEKFSRHGRRVEFDCPFRRTAQVDSPILAQRADKFGKSVRPEKAWRSAAEVDGLGRIGKVLRAKPCLSRRKPHIARHLIPSRHDGVESAVAALRGAERDMDVKIQEG